LDQVNKPTRVARPGQTGENAMSTTVTFWQGRPVANFWFEDDMTDAEARDAVRARLESDWVKSPQMIWMLEHAHEDVRITHSK
jgi:hypothetical protein